MLTQLELFVLKTINPKRGQKKKMIEKTKAVAELSDEYDEYQN
jgi:hypothetical protein